MHKQITAMAFLCKGGEVNFFVCFLACTRFAYLRRRLDASLLFSSIYMSRNLAEKKSEQ